MEETDNICFVCDQIIPLQKWKYQLQVTATKRRNAPVADLIAELVGDEFEVLVGERDAICGECMIQLNLMDSLLFQLGGVKSTLTQLLHAKYNLAEEDTKDMEETDNICFVCDQTILIQKWKYQLQVTATMIRNASVADLIAELVGDEFEVLVGERDAICRECMIQLNVMDFLLFQLGDVKSTLTQLLHAKYNLAEEDTKLMVEYDDSTHEEKDPLHKCEICNYQTKYEKEFNMHLRTHPAPKIKKSPEVVEAKDMEETDNICFVCDQTILIQKWKYQLQVTATMIRNAPVADLIAELVGDEFEVLVGERDAICRECMIQLNVMDFLLFQLGGVKSTLTQLLHAKYNLAEEDTKLMVEYDDSTHEERDPLHKCEICNYQTKYEKEFNMHLRTHPAPKIKKSPEVVEAKDMEETDNICFVCDQTIPLQKWKYQLQVTATKRRNAPVADLIAELVGDEFEVLVGERDAICGECMIQLNLMDFLLFQLGGVKSTLTQLLHAKYNLAEEDTKLEVEYDDSTHEEREPLHKSEISKYQTKYEKEFNMHLRTHPVPKIKKSPKVVKAKVNSIDKYSLIPPTMPTSKITQKTKTKNSKKKPPTKLTKKKKSTKMKTKNVKNCEKKKIIVYQYDVCNQVFPDENAIRLHCIRDHGNDKIVICDEEDYEDVQTLESSNEEIPIPKKVTKRSEKSSKAKLDFLDDWVDEDNDDLHSLHCIRDHGIDKIVISDEEDYEDVQTLESSDEEIPIPKKVTKRSEKSSKAKLDFLDDWVDEDNDDLHSLKCIRDHGIDKIVISDEEDYEDVQTLVSSDEEIPIPKKVTKRSEKSSKPN